jgi:hypothetical protein
VLSPTRELAIQIAEQFEALGVGIGVKTAVLVVRPATPRRRVIDTPFEPSFLKYSWEGLSSIARRVIDTRLEPSFHVLHSVL